MMYLATASGPRVRAAMRSGELGQLCRPNSNAVVPGVTWAADNGCFSSDSFSFNGWLTWLDRQPRTALWAVVPDVVGDHNATVDRWHDWADVVRRMGFAPAFVLQNGCETVGQVPADASALFVGGDDGYKLGDEVAEIVDAFDGPTHMGRVNSLRRLRVAARWGIDTVDGTFLAFGPDQNLGRLLRWMREVNTQASLEGVS